MLVYKVSEREGGPFYYRETDDGVTREFYNFLDSQEEGNTMYIEVVEITRKKFDEHARPSRL